MGHRFLYENLITEETMFSVSSLRAGIITNAIKEGTGSAELNPSGNYTGAIDKEYIVEIDSIAGGAEVGQSTFKWSDGSGGWNATGVATSAGNISLGSGAYINFSSGAGADFVVGDKWYFRGINLFNAGKMIDNNRDSRYRSAALGAPNTIAVFLDADAEVKALAIYGHNFSSAATILLEGDSAPTYDSDGGNAEFSEAVTWTTGKILHYLSSAQIYQYWRLSVTDAANPDEYIEVGELFLGSYLALTRNYSNGWTESINTLKNTQVTQYGIERDRFYNFQRTWELDFDAISPADVTNIKTLLAALGSRSLGTFRPFYFNFDSATPCDFWLVKADKLPISHITTSWYKTGLTLREVVESV